ALGEGPVAHLAARGPADRPRLAHRHRREVVVEVVLLPRLHRVEAVDDLLVVGRAERARDERLGLAAGEERRAVRARQDAELDRDRPDLVRRAAVDAPARERRRADDVALDLVDRARDVEGAELPRGGDAALLVDEGDLDRLRDLADA